MKKRDPVLMGIELALIVIVLGVIGVSLVTLLGPVNPGDHPPVNVCTAMGCYDSLWVHLTGNMPRSYTIKAAGFFSRTTTIDCPEGDQHSSEAWCKEDGAVFLYDPGSIPDELTITVTWEDNSKSETFKPTYSLHYPNGPDCEPECRKGNVTFELPDE